MELMLPLAMIALFTPSELWRGEPPARRGYFLAMPVHRMRHTLLRVLGGWAWLMAVVAVFLLWMAAVSRASGGAVISGDAHVLLRPLADAAPHTPADYFTHAWPVPAWQWMVPFAATTTLYLLGSIIPLSSNYPWRWYAGIALGMFLVMALGRHWPERVVHLLVPGPFGLEALLTGSAGREFMIASPAGGRVAVTAHAPMLRHWLSATGLWMAMGLAGLLIAAGRHRDS